MFIILTNYKTQLSHAKEALIYLDCEIASPENSLAEELVEFLQNYEDYGLHNR